MITDQHLKHLKELLSGEIYLNNRQMALWRLYSFDVIPIELISNIYQQFLHSEEDTDSDSGIYYTPFHLVSFLVAAVSPNPQDTHI